MKNEHGITLISLIVYILVFSLIIGILASMSSYIFGNLDNINSGTYSSEEFNKFNLSFIQEVKNNSGANIMSENGNVRIVFENGVNFNYVKNEKSIYRNKVKIAEKIVTFSAEDTTINNKNVLKVIIGTGKDEADFGKTINYVLKYW